MKKSKPTKTSRRGQLKGIAEDNCREIIDRLEHGLNQIGAAAEELRAAHEQYIKTLDALDACGGDRRKRDRREGCQEAGRRSRKKRYKGPERRIQERRQSPQKTIGSLRQLEIVRQWLQGRLPLHIRQLARECGCLGDLLNMRFRWRPGVQRDRQIKDADLLGLDDSRIRDLLGDGRFAPAWPDQASIQKDFAKFKKQLRTLAASDPDRVNLVHPSEAALRDFVVEFIVDFKPAATQPESPLETMYVNSLLNTATPEIANAILKDEQRRLRCEFDDVLASVNGVWPDTNEGAVAIALNSAVHNGSIGIQCHSADAPGQQIDMLDWFRKEPHYRPEMSFITGEHRQLWSSLSDRKRGILLTLYRLGAFDADKRLTAAMIAVESDGADANANGFKLPLRELRDLVLVVSLRKPGGGYYLTDRGKKLCESNA